jgi:protein-arginine kinase activator protein McsA
MLKTCVRRNKMNIGKWFVMLMVMLALTGAVLAENNDTNDDAILNITNGQALTVRYDHMQCKVTFTNTQIDLLKKYTGIDQTANKNKLLADMTTLKTYLDSTNREGFDNYTVQTIRPDLQNASKDLTNAKKSFKQYNVTNTSKTAFVNDLKVAQKTYSSCISDKEIKMAQVMERHMENWNKHWGKVVDKMAEKNITMEDAKTLQAEIAAKNAELKALIEEGNMTKIQEFMKAYREDQLHYAARFEIARLKGYRDKLEPIANKYNMSNRLHDIDEHIADAEKNAQPGHKYGDGEFKNTWDNIKDANKGMKETAKDINSERMQERRNMTGERPQAGQRPQKMPGREGREQGSGNLDNNSED